jgi:hypothetical protein
MPGRRRLERFDLILFAIVLLAAIPRLYLGATQFIEYDGYWHIFTAQQDRWRNFVWDAQNLAHPPLYYLLLRFTLWLGKSHLAYRAIPLVAGLASVAVLGRIAAKVMRTTEGAVLTALAYGLALPGIILSCEVRAYGLCTLFALIAYSFFLDLIEAESLRPRVLLAVSAALACATEYYAVFFVCALAGIGVLLPLVRRREPLWKAWAREVATFMPSAGVVVWLYFEQFRSHTVIQGHLLPFYYDPAGPETLGAFLLRNLQNAFDLFSPWPAAGPTVFLAIAAGLVVALGGTLWLLRRLREPKNLAAAATVVATVVILVELVVASVLRVYPFGGFLRQQSILFPFLVLCAWVLPDRLLAAIPRRAAYALAGLLSLAVLAVSYQAFNAYPKVKDTLLTEQMQKFDRLFPAPQAIYLDQFNLIAFYLHHDDWRWQFDGHVPGLPDLDVYRVSRGNKQLLVFRDRGRWILDSREPALDANLAACLRSRGLARMDLFRLAQDGAPWEAAELRAYRKSIAESTVGAGLCLQELNVDGRDVYAEVRTGGCSAPPQP